MSLPEPLADLLEAEAYPHPCGALEVVETHISWVILTGEVAYKLKKPVRFSFVDFSTVERRAHFCREELRCNRRFAPTLYLDVVAVVRGAGSRLKVAASGAAASEEVVEWAVKMRQFPPQDQLDRLLARDQVTGGMLHGFGRTLAVQHQALPAERGDDEALEARVLGPAWENFDDLQALDRLARHRPLLRRARAGMERQVDRHRSLLLRRLQTGWLRECHGDLHLSNLVLLEDGVTAFDCLEFNPDLRWIDPQSDVAFLFMDCHVRGRVDLAYAFLDGYLDEAGDYEGATLLPFYAAYRSMVRAKVAALRREQADASASGPLEERFRDHAAWTADWMERPTGQLVLMCGLSASGKSHLARRLVPRLGAIRLRSDVARKVLAGMGPRDRQPREVGAGLYGADTTRAVYDRLGEWAGDLLRSGEHVIVDATFIAPEQRAPFLTMAAGLGRQAVILHCDAPREVLEARLRARSSSGTDPSDASLAVLEHQARVFVPPRTHTLRVDTGEPLEPGDIEAVIGRLTDG